MEPENALEIFHLSKRYPLFSLDDVSFSLERGTIMGFIGRNGAGKSTTLKALFNIVHPDSGDVSFFGLPYVGNERAIKNRTAFSAGAFEYYQNKTLKSITEVTRRFYEKWDDAVYAAYLKKFGLDESKTPAELSEGMKVKYSLCLALSHNAELLILDEPTSGLDPVSRGEVLEIFLSLVEQGKTILFSTHIISDLEKCADSITYIQKGRILASCSVAEFQNRYKIAHFAHQADIDECSLNIKGIRRAKEGFTALIEKQSGADKQPVDESAATLEQIMVHLEAEREVVAHV